MTQPSSLPFWVLRTVRNAESGLRKIYQNGHFVNHFLTKSHRSAIFPALNHTALGVTVSGLPQTYWGPPPVRGNEQVSIYVSKAPHAGGDAPRRRPLWPPGLPLAPQDGPLHFRRAPRRAHH